MAPAFHPGKSSPAWFRRTQNALGEFLTGNGLPVFLTAAALIYEIFLLLVIFAPAGWGAWSDFAQEFKVWCFSYDPRTGGMEWMSVVIMLAEPAFIVGVLMFVWRLGRAHSESRRPWRGHRMAGGLGLAVGLAVAGSLYAYGRPDPTETAPPPFPGERIRTRLVPPDFALVDQRGQPVALADLRGRVTLVTGVYALCSTTCPQILVQVRKLLDSLPEDTRRELDVVALSLNPEYDTAELMRGVAEAYGFDHPAFRYLNGDPDRLRPVLRDFQFSARRDPATGVVEHANLFILLDAQGRIAYRFNLDQRHQGWLREAVLSLVAESRAPVAKAGQP